MPLIPIVTGAAFVAGLAAWVVSTRMERRPGSDMDDAPADASQRTRRRIETSVVVALGLAVIAGLMFDAFDRGTAFGRFDESIAEFGAANATSTSTAILDLITSLGGTRLITAFTVAAAIYAFTRSRSWWPAVYLTVVSAGQALVNNGIKLVVERERPNISQLADWSGASFPSGHSAAAAAAFAGIAFVLIQRRSHRARVWIVTAAVTVAVAVAATRALLGVHWLTDIIAGVAVGWAWFLLVTTVMGDKVTEPFHNHESRAKSVEVNA